jgi:hypothetical protein
MSRAGSATSANAASAGASTSGAPVWKPSHARTSDDAASGASSQSAESWSQSMSAAAVAVALSGAGGCASVRTGITVPGRAIASITALKTDCASKTGSAKPPSITSAVANISLLPGPA